MIYETTRQDNPCVAGAGGRFSKWGKTPKSLPIIRMLPREYHRDRVITPEEERRYLTAVAPPAQPARAPRTAHTMQPAQPED